MKFKNQVRALLFTLPAATICACNSSPSITYKISALRMFNAVDTGQLPVETTGPFLAKDYAIGFQTTATITGSQFDPHDPDAHFRLGNNVTALTVYSLTDFNAGHPALASLNDCFMYLGYNNPNSVGFTADSLDYVIKNGYVFTNVGFDRTTLAGGSYDYLTLLKPPDSLGARTFAVHVVFADGTIFNDTTIVTLLK